MVFLVIVVYIFIVLTDPYGLLKQGLKRDFYICSALCLISFFIAFAMAMKWPIPSPSPIIVSWVKKLL